MVGFSLWKERRLQGESAGVKGKITEVISLCFMDFFETTFYFSVPALVLIQGADDITAS